MAIRAAVVTYFMHCLRCLDEGMMTEARDALDTRRWRASINPALAPAPVVSRTDALCTESALALDEGDEVEAAFKIASILDAWT